MPAISHRLARLEPSATRAISERAADLRAAGEDVISLSTGEPDFVSPPAAMDAARVALDEGKTFYTPTAGIPELKTAIAEYYEQHFGVSCARLGLMVGAGAKPLLFQAFGALVNPNDEVIIIAPAWVSYIEQVRFFDGRPVIVESDPKTLDFSMDDIEKAITPRTKAIVLNTPNNPSGRLYDDALIEALCALVVERDLALINDEVYERIVYDGRTYRHPLALCPAAAAHVLNVNAVSKTYAMTGWRIGFAVGPATLIKRMTMLQGHTTSGPSSVAQWAALGAIRGAQTDVADMVSMYQSRKDLIVRLLADIPGLRCIPPEGAFYLFIDIRGLLGRKIDDDAIVDDVSFCEALLEHRRVAIVPGTAFLQPGFVRLSFATSTDIIEAAIARIADFVARLSL